MAHIPQSVLDRQPDLEGLELRSRGKVRDSYEFSDYPDNMLVVASDRCSIFDFVLPTLVPEKGQILTALNHFWTQKIGHICDTDFVACGKDMNRYLPKNLHNNLELQKRATVVRIHPAPEVEDIVRLVMAGSGWTSYKQNHRTICGHRLPPELKEGDLLPYPIYAPTTKAKVGHDEHMLVNDVIKEHGFMRERLALQVACTIADHALKCGIRLFDTKFEFSGETIVDEKGTPDSSRFVDEKAWRKAQEEGKLPPPLDKQYVREWGKKNGIDSNLDPTKPENIKFVDSAKVPSDVVHATTLIYRYIFWRLTGMQIEIYQKNFMGIDSPVKVPRIEVIVGSESDLCQIDNGMTSLMGISNTNLSIISCHRNPEELRKFLKEKASKADVFIAGAGMAAALPGIVKAELCALGQVQIPVIGVAFKGKTEQDDLAAKLSIECLPGQPVEMDRDGKAYFGPEGFLKACESAVYDEFLPKKRSDKPAQIHIHEIH